MAAKSPTALRRIRAAIVPLVVLATVAVLAIVYRARLADWFAGRGGAGTFGNPTRVVAGTFTVETSLAPDPPRQNDNHVRVDVFDGSGAPVDGADLLVTYDMPEMGSMPEMKGTAKPTGRGNGRYQGSFDLPMGGSWGLTVAIEAGGTRATAHYSFTVGTPGVQALDDGGEADPPPVATPVAPPVSTKTYPPAALTALGAALEAYAKVSSGLAADLVDQPSARRLALAQRDAARAVGHADHPTMAALEKAAALADSVATTKDVATARKLFAELSEALVPIAGADARLAATWKLFECPMAPGYQRWFQKDAAPQNPYMGQEMAACVSEVAWSAPPPPPPPSETGEIRIDPARRAAIGVRTAPVVKAPMTLDLRAVGRLTYDESKLTDVTLKVAGFITDLRVATTGRAVKRGETLFTLYSPELYAAQQEYLAALRNRGDGGATATASAALVRASEQRLRLLGLSAAQLAQVASTGEPIEHIPFASPASGYVIEKAVVEGSAVDVGARIFRLAALDTIWVEADLYEPDLRHVKAGTPARVSLDYAPGEVREGKVTFVYPYLDPLTRTGRVRIALANRGFALKPDMYATVLLQVPLGERVQVPTAAIIVTGTRRIVFVDGGRGRLRPVEITTGAENADLTEVQSGLAPGDLVVTSGNFLVASESRLRSSAAIWLDEPAPASKP
jgi:Cu(I)/Ag(I) efflux system membrane fusion protein